MHYNQFCPIAKATEILGEKWTILIVREVLMGGRRFNELQRGLGDISPALLTSRLKMLEQKGMIVRRRIPGQRGYEYYPTEACEALLPIIMALGEWSLLWARHTILDADLDVEFLMFYLERSIDPSKLIGTETVIKFRFADLSEQPEWWLLVRNDKAQVCLKDPGKDVNVYFDCSVRTMHDVWMGDRTYREAMKSGDLSIQGDPALTRNVQSWLTPSAYIDADRSPLPLD
ncbi:winged helix-turn-helix transcriptional regulator [Tropicimonas sp. TH_r6]|uniref:winged helix-turn-helix transcriptional regulator n=1 Tax=Tropicimonas sp. TH_r6 TaxID=3082085 RepID=UPI002954250D|nr:winged helix-turn-helix transcriptional regulator [Tropicimonas sp. TH_r6]MDV7145734.1 winged helix-turn-helix transcriptional regulator [Tropicimonas sp. TH_r6]